MPLGVVKGLVESRVTQAGMWLECGGREGDGRIEGPSGTESARTSHVPRAQHLRNIIRNGCRYFEIFQEHAP